MQINLSAVVIYNNCEGYRQCIRDFFQMDTEKIKQTGKLEGLEGIDLDEQLYDENAIAYGIDYIYSTTVSDTAFAELYRLAAAVMLSENLEIGCSVLFSYDYFATFSKCLVEKLATPPPPPGQKKNEWYMILYNKLSK